MIWASRWSAESTSTSGGRKNGWWRQGCTRSPTYSAWDAGPSWDGNTWGLLGRWLFPLLVAPAMDDLPKSGFLQETAHVVNQRYKEGMFILERCGLRASSSARPELGGCWSGGCYLMLRRFKVLGPDGNNCCESEDSLQEEEEDDVADDSLNLP